MKFWQALERLPGGAVMFEWQRELGDEFERARPFLSLSPDAAKTFPCTNAAGCGYPHHIDERVRGRWLAVNHSDEWCAPIELEAKDLLLFSVDVTLLCRSIAKALEFRAPVGDKRFGTRVESVGLHGSTNAKVYLMFPGDGARMMREVERLFCAQPDPFIVLTPTGIHCPREVETALKRQSCAHISLADALTWNGSSGFSARKSVRPMLERFASGMAHGNGLAKTVERIDRNLESVANQNQELRAAKARLEAMQAEGLFAFASKIDHDTLKILFAILANGDVAKASRGLKMSDSTLRGVIASWKRRGKAYVALADFVRWRKSIKGKAGKEFTQRLASGGERDTDWPAMVRDILEMLEQFNSDNWAEKCDQLAEVLREVV